MRKILILLVAALATAGCSTYSSKMEASRDLYYEGEYEEAMGKLNKLVAESSGNDVYLYLLERGKTRLAFGEYDSAIVDLQEAEARFGEIEGTVSVSEFLKTTLISPEKMEYVPQEHEMILISSYLLLAYWLGGDIEGAYVERNRVLGRLGKYTDRLSQEDWEKLDVPFARYLCALLYEIEGLADDARIEYDLVARHKPDARPDGEHAGLTEMVVFAELGRGPVKVSREIKGYFNKDAGALIGFFNLPGAEEPMMVNAVAPSGFNLETPGVVFSFAFPEYIRQPRVADHCKVVIDGLEAAEAVTLDHLEDTAMEAFKKDLGGILMKSAFRAYLKVTAQTKLSDKGKGVFDLLGKVLSAIEKADTRSWQTLPAEIGLFRMECEPGEHEVYLNYYDERGNRVGSSFPVRFTADEGGKQIVYFPGPS